MITLKNEFLTVSVDTFGAELVSVKDNQGEAAEATLDFATEILPNEWQGKWIKPKKHIMGWAPYLRQKFFVSGEVVKARL